MNINFQASLFLLKEVQHVQNEIDQIVGAVTYATK